MEKSGSMWNCKILAGKEMKNPGGLLGMQEPKLFNTKKNVIHDEMQFFNEILLQVHYESKKL